jgi:type II secretory pathway component PulM
MAMSRLAFFDAWRNRRAGERWLLGAPVVALLVAGLHIGVVEPLQASTARLRAKLPALEAQRDRIRAQLQEYRAPAAPPRRSTLERANVEAALDRHGLKGTPVTIDAQGGGRLRVALPNAPFFAIWPLLQTLQNDYGGRVVTLRLDRLDASNARVEVVLAAGER